jgi:hypothetical protein
MSCRENKLAASVRMLLPINDEPQHLRLIFMHPKQTTAKILARSFTEVTFRPPNLHINSLSTLSILSHTSTTLLALTQIVQSIVTSCNNRIDFGS